MYNNIILITFILYNTYKNTLFELQITYLFIYFFRIVILVIMYYVLNLYNNV